jgi:GTPase SAR1 family protein
VSLTGKKIAILGPRAAGKTTLYDYLQDGTVATARSQTIAPTKRDALRHKDLRLSIKKGRDVPGSDVHYPEWRRLFKKADIVFYVFDAHLTRTELDYRERLSRDGRQLRKWGADKKVIYLVGTHRDKDPMAARCSAADYTDEILELDVIEALRARVRAKSIAVGDLETDRSAGALIRRVMRLDKRK